MKFHVVFEDSGKHLQFDSFTQVLVGLSLELNALQNELVIEADPKDGNQYDEVFLNAALVATIYTDEQYQRVRS